jgi:ABC-type oligopeptide transport system substrate-binding subunit
VVAVLDRLGYRASLRPLQLFPVDADVTDYWEVTDDKAADWNAALNGWVPDYPAASQFLATLASCDSRYDPYNVTGYCDPEVETAIAAALEQQVADPAAASAAGAAIDRKVVDSAAYIPFGNNIREDFVSRRAGNVIVHPVTGPLIAQMWVQ